MLSWLDVFFSAVEPAFLQLFNMSITASYVILAVMLVRLLFRRLPKRYSYALWAVVAFRLLCPVSIGSFLSIFNLGLFDMTNATKGAALVYIPGNIGTMAEPSVTVGIPELNAAISESLPAPAPEASVNPLQVWQAVATLIWLLGVAALLGYAGLSLWKVRRTVRSAVRLEGTRDVYECDGVRSPFVLGIFRPRIYLPFRLTEGERAHVLAHERFHLRHGDHVIKPFAFLLTTLYWFNPLVWIAYACMCADLEMRCDEAVLGKLPQERRADYSMALLALGAGRHFALASPLAFGETGVKRRIKNALSFRKPAVWVAVLAAAACACVAFACATNAKERTAPILQETSEDLSHASELYAFAECLYISPLSSDTSPATEGVAELYEVKTDSFSILDAQTQTVKREFEEIDWAFVPVEDDAFNALFMLNAPDLSQYESRLQCELGNGYVLYKMDDATWLGRMATHGGAHAGEKYMWSLYRLTPIADLGSLSSSGSKSPFLALEPKAGRYALEDGSAWLDLNADGTFVFALHSGENGQPSGAWEYEDGSLVLYAGEDTYRFTVALDGETLYFAAESGTEKGKAFRYCGNTTQLLQWEKEMYPSEDGVAGFLTLAAEHGISTGYEGDACYNVTPAWIAEATDDYAIFKYNRSCASYLSYDGAVYPLGMWFGGFGFTDAALADLDGDRRNELYFTCSYGSGMHWAQAGYFDPVSKEVKLFSFSYPLDGVEGCSELALRVQEDGIGVYAAQIACSKGETQFVELSLAPQEELGSISCLDGVIAFFEKDGTWHTAEGMGKEAS